MKDIYISSLNSIGTYQCIIDTDNGTVWMYLHDHSKEQVAGDAPICSLDRLVSVADFKKNFKNHEY
jgi:hypothetical protein